MMLFYVGITYPRFCDKVSFIWEHLFIFALWAVSTWLVMMGVRDILIRLHLRFVYLPAVIVPAVSCFLIYLFYITAFIGNIAWDENLGLDQVLGFLPNLFDLAENFSIPPILVVAIFIVPLISFLLIFHSRVKEMVVWHWVVREKFTRLSKKNKRFIIFLGFPAWFLLLFMVASADTSREGFFNFSNDPLVTFFKPKPSFYAMTRERLYWVLKDQKAQKDMKRKIPKVHNIFLFCVDALRADHLPLYGYRKPITPYLNKFFPEAHARWIDTALSTGLDTVTGTICMVNSKEPIAMSQFNFSLPDYLSDEGYHTELILSGGHTWQKNHQAFGRKIDVFIDGSENPGPKGICDDEMVIDEVANLKPDDGEFHFFYFHLLSVHPLGVIEDKYLRYIPTRNIIIDNNPFLGNTLQDVVNLYDDRILQMDDVMRKILAMLKQKGYMRDYIAVFTADHGQILGEKGRYGHGHFADISGLRIPMIFFSSSPLPPFPETQFGCQLDIAPTLTDLAGLGVCPTWQGQSLLRPRTNPWTYHLSPYSHPGQEGAVVYYSPEKTLKYTRVLEHSEDDPGKLYDLTKDPEENHDLLKGYDLKFIGSIRSEAHLHFTNF